MTDLEHMALKKDRGYLVRLLLLLVVGVLAGLFVVRGLTGEHVGGCLAETLGGTASTPETRTK